MKKLVKIIKRILLVLIISVGCIFLSIFIARKYNDNKYKSSQVLEGYMDDVFDISLYPSKVDNIDINYVDRGAFQGFHLVPSEKRHDGIVVCFGGSEGSPNFQEALNLSKKGYETFATFMFGMKNQKETLTKIPLEQVEDIFDYIKSLEKDDEPITFLGASKGAEYILNIAVRYKEIDNLILIGPSAYTFAGLDFNDIGSSWTYKGKELAYVDMQKANFTSIFNGIILPSIISSPLSYTTTYNDAIKNDPSSLEALIPVKDTDANILLIAGSDDGVWDSKAMANLIAKEKEDISIHVYEGAGHIFSEDRFIVLKDMKLLNGGSLEVNQKAKIESEKVIDEFLEKNHIIK